MEFEKEILMELASTREGKSVLMDGKTYTIKENKIADSDRWTISYDLVFEVDGRFFCSWYSRGATEYQEESPYENEDDMVDCSEVFPVEKTIIVYE